MPQYSESNTPEQNLELLANNPYPGRLLVVGFTPETQVLAYAVMGRSDGSRNRVLTLQDNVVGTEVADYSISAGDPELTIYDALRKVGDIEIVSNGNQTDRVVRYVRCGKTFMDAMGVTFYEPDDPNFTPRITGFHHSDADENEPFFGISVISKDPASADPVRKLYTNQTPELGFVNNGTDAVGYCVHTYNGDGDPLPSFDDLPFRIPVQETAFDMADMLWETLDSDNRVAVVAKYISLSGVVAVSIRNRHDSEFNAVYEDTI